jgi:hypothetical protein
VFAVKAGGAEKVDDGWLIVLVAVSGLEQVLVQVGGTIEIEGLGSSAGREEHDGKHGVHPGDG